ncbi:hypothetical protein F5X99DRAFT_396342 [Biscogniauxia marginata]|nr:hypothetical protein F5X99DRAFT_396342 [Biscogniauxia marginata]
MLVLIAGITGMCGQAVAKAALSQGHKVRGSGRSPDKLDSKTASQLEGFVQTKDMLDTAALDKAVSGVDAVVCALNNAPEVIVAGQLALLWAAERAGVKIFHAASWNYDWTKLQPGDHENYDAYLAFKRTAELTSAIKLIYGFTGGILEWSWYYSDRGTPIDTKSRTISYFGDGTQQSIWITVDDLTAYTLKAITAPEAANGGNYYVESFRCTWLEMGETYGKVRGIQIKGVSVGDENALNGMLQGARQATSPRDWRTYIGLAYAKLFFNPALLHEPTDSKKWSDIKQTSLKEWFEQHPDV